MKYSHAAAELCACFLRLQLYNSEKEVGGCEQLDFAVRWGEAGGNP